MNEAEPRHEIIIVRRASDDDDGHHGGVWKIAFADFMTAMMCFFLVMWLINAADEETRTSVASYFNPVKLTDRSAGPKGVEDMTRRPDAAASSKDAPERADQKEGRQGEQGQGVNSATQSSSSDSPEEQEYTDAHLFAQPYAVLSEIALETDIRQNVSDKGDGGAQAAGPATGASGGEAYRDPFAPDFWTQQVASPTAAEASAERPKSEPAPNAQENREGKPLEGTPAVGEAESSSQAAQLAKNSSGKEAAEGASTAETANVAADKAEDNGGNDSAKPTPPAPGASTAAEAEALRKELAAAFKPGDKIQNGISVEATDKGVVISVTDLLDFGMFEIGSAVPRRELVLAMEKIGKMLAAHDGRVIINGHTDGRPFRSDTYDNWRLSTARAHSAYYMLVRGGLDERRISEVAGFADRRLKDPADPLSPTNRRIEILLETSG